MESRIEDIVSATISGESYNKPAGSRIETSLIDLKEHINGKVDKVSGKGLSTNDFTTAEKTKLNDLAEIKSIGTGLALDSSTGELVATGGSGGGGTLDYTELINKPQINSVTLSGNKSLSDLGITYESKTAASDGTALSLVTTGEKYTWNNKQSAIDDLSTIRSGAALGATAVQPVTGKGLSTNDYTDTEKSKLTDIAAGAEVNKIEGIKVNSSTINPDANKVVNITVPTTAADVSALPDTTKYAAALSLTINSSTFVMTGQLKDQNGDNLGTTQIIDLPLESVVVGGSYNSQTKKVVLTLQNGNTIEFSVADLVAGLQTELSESNKLNPVYIAYDSTHRAVSDTEKSTWNGKQNALTTAQLAAVNSGIDSTKVEQIETNKNNILYTISNGVKNLSPTNAGSATRRIAIPLVLTAGTYTVYIGSILSTDTDATQCQIVAMIGNTVVSNYLKVPRTTGSVYTFNVTGTSDMVYIYASDNYAHSDGDTVTISDFMICKKSVYDADPSYQPYAMSNAELTAKEQANKNNISSLTPDIKRVTVFSGGTTYSMVSDCMLTLAADNIATVYRISGFLGVGSVGIRGIILSQSNNSADFDTEENVLCKAEQSSGMRSTLACDDIWFNSTDNPRYVYCWVKLATSGTGRVYTIAERLG